MDRRINNPILWHYYSYCREYGRQPVDIDDMLDGLICLWAKNEIEEIYGSAE